MDPGHSRARRGALFTPAAAAALALAMALGAATATATPYRPETGLPYAPDATPAAAAMGVGSLHGPVGPLELGLLADLFVTYRLVSRQDSLFHEFELSRVQASAWAAYRSLAGVNLTVDTIRSSGSRSYFGVDGDAILPRLKWAFAEVTPWRHYLSLRAGIVPDLLLQYAEAAWGFRVQGPTGLERDALYTPGDLGATVEAALPFQLGSVALQVGNGEGLALREQNNGKNLTAALRIAPLRSRAPDFLLHFVFRDGSLGAGSAADRRGSFGLTYAGTRLGAGALGTVALGYRGLGDRTAAHLTTWLRGELPVGLALLARADVLWPDTALGDSMQLRAICGLAYSLPALVRLVASYEGTLPFGALVAQVPALTEHALLIQAEVRL